MRPQPPLILEPRACDRCGKCLAACPHDALTVGRTYLKVDWAACDGCGACARACPRGAIVWRGASAQPARAAAGRQPAAAGSVSRSGASTPRSRSAGKAAAGKSGSKKGGAAKGAAGPSSGIFSRLSGVGVPPRGGSRGGFQWTLLEAAAMLSVTFSAFMVKEVLSASEVMIRMPPGLEIPARVGVLALYYAAQVAILVWLVRRRGGDVLSAIGLRRGEPSLSAALVSTALVAAGLVGTRLVASGYVYLTRAFGLMPSASVDLPALFGSDAVGFLLAVVMVVIVGPVVEEAVFRAALLEGLTARFGISVAVVVQAALFAAFHRSLWLLFPTFILGLVLGWLAHSRESLRPPIVLHAAYNAITVAAAFLVAGAP